MAENIVILDTNWFGQLALAGGPRGDATTLTPLGALDRFADTVDHIIIPSVVEYEIRKGPQSAEYAEWRRTKSNKISVPMVSNDDLIKAFPELRQQISSGNYKNLGEFAIELVLDNPVKFSSAGAEAFVSEGPATQRLIGKGYTVTSPLKFIVDLAKNGVVGVNRVDDYIGFMVQNGALSGIPQDELDKFFKPINAQTGKTASQIKADYMKDDIVSYSIDGSGSRGSMRRVLSSKILADIRKIDFRKAGGTMGVAMLGLVFVGLGGKADAALIETYGEDYTNANVLEFAMNSNIPIDKDLFVSMAQGAAQDATLKVVASFFGVGLIWMAYDVYQNIDGLTAALDFAAKSTDSAALDALNDTVQSAKTMLAGFFEVEGSPPTQEDIAMEVGFFISENFDSATQALIAESMVGYLENQNIYVNRYDKDNVVVMTMRLMEYANEKGIAFSGMMKDAVALHLAETDVKLLVAMIPDACFAAGTQIDMWDGSRKPIEDVQPDDVVLSYDAAGALVPGRVTQTFAHSVSMLLDLFGTKVTPGHVSFCGDGVFAGQHVPMIDILRSDGALVLRDGTKVRAATGAPLDTAADKMIMAVTGAMQSDGTVVETSRGEIRVGTRVILADGRDISLYDIIIASGAKIASSGLIETAAGVTPFHWDFSSDLPKPEDYVLARSKAHLAEIYAANEWEGVAPQLPLPSHLAAVGQGPALQ